MSVPPTSRAALSVDTLASGRVVAVVALLAASLLLPGLGAIDLWAPDEPRYAQVAEELLDSPGRPTDLVLLRLNGEVYTQKPPLYFWLAALVGAVDGRVDEIDARLPSALAGVAVAVLTAWLGRLLSGRWTTGLLAALVLLTLPRFAHQARRAQLDVLLTLFELAALIAYVRIETLRIDVPPPAADRPPVRWLWVLHGAVALALLTKGPVGALPWLVIVVHRAIERRTASLRALFPIRGVALALAPALAWAGAAIALSAPGYWHEAIVDNLFARFLVGTDHVRPFWYFAWQLPLDALPWTPVMGAAAIALWRERSRSDTAARIAALLFAWTLVFVLFFSLSAGKRGLYMLPLFPGLAVLAAWALTRWLDVGQLPMAFRAGAGAILLAISGLCLVLASGPPGIAMRAGIAEWPRAPIWSVTWVGISGAVALALGPRSRHRAALGIAATFASLLLLETIAFQRIQPLLDPQKSPRAIGRLVDDATAPGERVGVFRHGAFTGGLEYYSQRRVVGLESAHDVERFVASGSRIVVVRERDLSSLVAGRPHGIRGAARSGTRRLLVVELLFPSRVSRPRTP